ncbi:MAG: 23S rRNA (guanosine(2251)-2'-O)-methyltransferase RlmB, partial [Bacteroidia bacterium]|nr:23S rRNA (guanosine(2251)-2'-O)-methyltransferase RlmB [Bacteroidia bacterium]
MALSADNFIFGTRAVIEALKAGKELEKILIQKGLNNQLFHELRKELQGREIPYQIVPQQKLDRLTSKNHQGVVAMISEITYYKAEDLLGNVFESGKIPLVLVLDKVTDVRNFGAIARSAECAGADMIVIADQGSAQVNADAMKTSAGALHRIPVCRERNLKATIEFLKESGLQIISCHEKTDTMIYEADFKIPTAIIMGAEDSGISPEYLKRSDLAVKIPMKGQIASLNVSVA